MSRQVVPLAEPVLGEAAPAPLLDLAGRPEGGDASASSDATVFTTAVYAAQVLQFLAGLIQKGILGPAGTGYWALMQAFWQFATVASIGAVQGTSRQVPLHRGRKDYAAAAATSATGASFSLLMTVLAGALTATCALAFGAGWAPEIRWGLVILGLTAPLRLLGDIHETLLGATKRFRPVSAATVLQAAIALTLQTGFVYLWGFYGMFAGTLAATVGTLILFARMGLTGLRRPIFTWRIDRARLRELISYGFPILLFGQIWLLFMGIDNLIVAGFLSIDDLGYYALAVSVTSYILFLPKSLAAVLFPRMAERYGETGDMGSIGHYATDVQRILGYMLVPAFVGAAFFLLPVLVRHALPDFEPAIPVIHIMVAGSFFISLCNMPIKVLTTAGRRLPLIIMITACLAFNAAANYVAVAVLDEGIEGAAVATVISYFAVFVITSGYSLAAMLGRRRMVLHIGELLLVFVYMSGALWGLESLLGSGAGAFVPDTATGTLKLLLFLALLAPWLWVAQHRVQGPQRIWALVRRGVAAAQRRRAG
jgi:O-antigen/teichoic acid export membrane protein